MPIRPTPRRMVACLLLLAAMGARTSLGAPDATGSEGLTRFLDSLDVENLWLARTRVDWETGTPAGPSSDPAHSTHCSAFVAAVCRRLGVPMLNPPEHPQRLLANAQSDWLAEQGPRHGWRRLDGAADARQGFRAHPAAFAQGQIAYFAHPVTNVKQATP